MTNFSNKLLLISLLIKIGSAPLHFWIPLVIEGLNWNNNYLLITWQKLGPLVLITNNLSYSFLRIFIILSSSIRSFIGLNQTSLKKIITYSSINQIRWLILSLCISKYLIKIYFLFYFLILLNIIIIFNKFNLYYLNQLFNIKIYKKSNVLFIFSSILSMGGLPPFLGFYPKILIIINFNNSILLFLLIMFTLIILFFYLRLAYFIILIDRLKINKLKPQSNIKLIFYLSFLTNYFLLIIILFLNFKLTKLLPFKGKNKLYF